MMAIGIQFCLSVKVISPTLILLRKMRCSACHEQKKNPPTVVEPMIFCIPFGCLNYRATAKTQARSFHNQLDAYFQCWVILRF